MAMHLIHQTIAFLLAIPIVCAAQDRTVVTTPPCAKNELAKPFFPKKRTKEIGEFVVARDHLGHSIDRAVWTMDADLALQALAGGADPNGVSGGNHEPLIVIAAIQGSPQVLAALIAHGARIDSVTSTGTPLYWAARQGNLEAVRLLLACGANVNYKATDGGTALHMTLGDDNDIQVAVALIDAGADLEARKSEMTPLMQAAMFGRTAWVELLIKRGANVNAKTPNGASVLDFAGAIVKSPQIVEALVKAGAK